MNNLDTISFIFQVTYITPRPPKVPLKDVHIVDISLIRERYISSKFEFFKRTKVIYIYNHK